MIFSLISVHKLNPELEGNMTNNKKLLDELKAQERSIAWLSRKCNITRAYMHKMIHGKRNFSELYKNKCADALRVRYKELFGA